MWGVRSLRPRRLPASLLLQRGYRHGVTVIEKTPDGAERMFDLRSRLLRERVIQLFGPITDETCWDITSQLLILEAEDAEKPIHMYINSPGGEVTQGLAIYDTMQYIKPSISTTVVGHAASMASLLLSAGEPGMRHALPNSSIMLHQPSIGGGGLSGMASDIKIQTDQLLARKHMLNELYVNHTGQELGTVEKVLDRDTFMKPQEARDFGIIDSILVHRPDA